MIVCSAGDPLEVTAATAWREGPQPARQPTQWLSDTYPGLLGGACPATRTALPALVQSSGVRGLWLSCGRETTAVRHDTAQRMARVQITRRVLPLNTLAQQIVHVLPAHAPHTVWTRVHPHAHYHKRPFASSLQSGAQAGTRPHMEV